MSVVPYPDIPHSPGSSVTPRPDYSYTAMTSGALRGRRISGRTVYDVQLTHTAVRTVARDLLQEHYRDHAADFVQVRYAGHDYELRYLGPPEPRMIVPGLYDIATRFVGHRVSTVPGWDVGLDELQASLAAVWYASEGASETDGIAPALDAIAAFPLPYSQQSAVVVQPQWQYDPMHDGELIGRRDAARDVAELTLVHPFITQRQLDNLLRHYQQYQRHTVRLSYAGSVYDAHYLGEPAVHTGPGPHRTATVQFIGSRIASAWATSAMQTASAALLDALWPIFTQALVDSSGHLLVDADNRALITQHRVPA